MKWSQNNGLLTGKYLKPVLTNQIAGFDLDGTIILTKSGKKFPVDNKDWKLFENSCDKIKELAKKYSIVIVTNQKGLKTEEDIVNWQEKLEAVCKTIKVPITIFASLKDDKYRKPLPTIWNMFDVEVNNSKSFYCGDAAGRNKDFSNTDIMFAMNCKIDFYTPEQLFLDQNDYGIIPEKYLFEPTISNKNLPKEQCILMMVGYPASGKTTLSKEIVEKYPNWNWCNRDELLTDSKCVKKTIESLNTGKSIIVDNTNPTLSNRKIYIDIANKYKVPIYCWILDVSLEMAWHQNWLRVYQTNAELIPKVAYYTFRKRYVEPSLNEGFTEIVKVKPDVNKQDLELYNLFTSPIN